MKTKTTLQNHTTRRGFLSAMSGMALLAMAPAFAGNGNVGNPNILPPQSHPYGASYAKWAERYWQWAHAGGTAESVQSGPVWFLASAPFSPVPGAATLRGITVPAGTALFGPVLSFFNNNDGVVPPLSGQQLLADANATWDALAIRTECIIDGVKVKGLENPQQTPYRVQTGVYRAPLAGGGTTEEVAVGAFLMIKPLSAGTHTVRLVGAIEPAPGFVLTKDVTYTIIVTRDSHCDGHDGRNGRNDRDDHDEDDDCDNHGGRR